MNGARRCMSCRAPWSEEFVATSISKNWFKTDYAAHVAKTLADQQQPFMAPTQRLVGIKRERDAAERAKRDTEAEILALRARLATQEDLVATLTTAITDPDTLDDNSYTYKYPCVKPDCKGHMASAHPTPVASPMTCALCATQACAACLTECSTQPHVCPDDAAATMIRIRETSKQCPACYIYIQKSEGCSQMWCTRCHTLFDYNTLQIDRSRFHHNPVYHDYLAANPAAREAANEGRIAEFEASQGYIAAHNNAPPPNAASQEREPRLIYFELELKNAPRRLLNQHDAYTKALYDYNKLTKELARIQNPERAGRLLRLKYLDGEITHEQMGHELRKIHQSLLKSQNIHQAYNTYLDTVDRELAILDPYLDPSHEQFNATLAAMTQALATLTSRLGR